MATLKKCCSCKQELDVALFNKRGDGLQRQCKTCQRKSQNAYYARNSNYRNRLKASATKDRAVKRDKVFDILKQSACVHCGESDPIVLSFDHIDPKTKKTEICNLVNGCYSWKVIEEELAKCQVLCFNCHVRKTAKENNWHRGKYKDVNKEIPPIS